MSFPQTATWQSSAPLSAWWRNNAQDGSQNVCATQGLTFIKQLQTAINSQISGPWTNPFDQSDLHTGQINVDGNWGSLTTQGLYKMAFDRRAPSSVLAAIERDWRSNTPGRPGNQFSSATLLAAIWVSQHPDLDISKVAVMSSAVAPRWDVAPPNDAPNANLVACWPEGSAPPNPASYGQPSPGRTGGGGDSSLPMNPISQPGLVGSTSGGTSSGAGFVIGAALALAGGVVGFAALVSKKRRRRRRR